MAKGDHDNAMNAISAQRASQTNTQNQLGKQFQTQYDNAYSSDQNLKNVVTGGYQKFLDPSYVDSFFGPGGAQSLRDSISRIGGAGGGIDPNLIKNMGATPYAGYQELAKGLSPEFRAQFNKSMGDLDTGIASYKDFVNTGGFSDADIANMRAQSTAPTRQIYQTAADNMTTAENAAHGNMGNASVAQARMAADAADKIGAVNTNTESNLAQMRQQGKEFGTSGLTQASLGEAQAKTAIEQLDAQLKEAGLGGMTDIEKSRMQGELQNAQINSSAGAANAQISLGKNQLALQEAEFEAGLPMGALKGMTDLYGTTPADTALAGKDQLNLLDLAQGGNTSLINSQIHASDIPGDFQQGMNNVGSVMRNLVSPIAGAFTGGLSNFMPSVGRMTDPYTSLGYGSGGSIPYGNDYSYGG